MWRAKSSSLQKSKIQTKFQEQLHLQDQKMIVDQNYANNIFFMVFSALQSLAGSLQGKTPKKTQKMYGNYDHYEYHDKSSKELLSQLKNAVMLFKTSKEMFDKKYGKNNYVLPSQFNEHKFFKQTDKFKKIFQKYPEVLNLVKDFANLMKDSKSKTNVDYYNFDHKYDVQEGDLNKKMFIKTAIFSGNMMKQEKKKIVNSKVKNSKDLPVYLKETFNSNLKKDKYK